MSEGFVALTARSDKHRIAADDGLMWRFAGLGAKDTLPENGLGILKIALNEKLDFIGGSSEVNDGHLAAESMERVIARGDDAASGVENKFALRIFFQAGKNFGKHGDFFSEVLRFAFGVGRAVGPTHPSSDAVNAGVASGGENGSEAGFDLVVATNRGTTESGEIFGPVGFAGAGHTDESEAKRLVRMRPHGELESVKDTRWSGKCKRANAGWAITEEICDESWIAERFLAPRTVLGMTRLIFG
jgi:hypothetical protein